MEIDFFNTNLLDEIKISVLLIETKSWGGIWSFGENAIGLYMGSRQIFETSHEVHKREENNKLNK
jgi:hypothetical protein